MLDMWRSDMKESDEYVIVYADTYFDQREEWNVHKVYHMQEG